MNFIYNHVLFHSHCAEDLITSTSKRRSFREWCSEYRTGISWPIPMWGIVPNNWTSLSMQICAFWIKGHKQIWTWMAFEKIQTGHSILTFHSNGSGLNFNIAASSYSGNNGICNYFNLHRYDLFIYWEMPIAVINEKFLLARHSLKAKAKFLIWLWSAMIELAGKVSIKWWLTAKV